MSSWRREAALQVLESRRGAGGIGEVGQFACGSGSVCLQLGFNAAVHGAEEISGTIDGFGDGKDP